MRAVLLGSMGVTLGGACGGESEGDNPPTTKLKHRPVATVCENQLGVKGDAQAPVPDAGPGTDECATDEDCPGQYGYCGSAGWGFTGSVRVCKTGCVQDGDCGAGQICNCEAPIGHCVTATCATDASCGKNELCLEHRSVAVCGGFETVSFACAVPGTQCGKNEDCGEPYTACIAGNCVPTGVCGRPFLVEGVARVAGVIYDAEEYVDVFCTHLQAGCDFSADAIEFVSTILALGLSIAFPGPDLEGLINECDDAIVRNIQASQLNELRTFIDQRAQPRDRPAFVVGDFNANGGGLDAHQAVLYGQVLSHLGLVTLTPFDAANQLFTKRYDLALGCAGQLPYSVPPVIPTAACDPVLTPDVIKFKSNLPPGPKWPRLGVGTNIAEDEYCDASQLGTLGDVDSARYDHVFIYPAAGAPGELPVFAIPNDPEPHVTVNSYPDPSATGSCLSDHKAVTAHIDLVRLKDKLTFNPNMTHEITYTMNRVENLTGDASGGAEFYSKFEYSVGPVGGTKTKNYGVFKDDSDVIYPNWHVKNLSASCDYRGPTPVGAGPAGLRWGSAGSAPRPARGPQPRAASVAT